MAVDREQLLDFLLASETNVAVVNCDANEHMALRHWLSAERPYLAHRVLVVGPGANILWVAPDTAASTVRFAGTERVS